ncbi:glycosyltransferase family 4 protein [Jatrophihabitans sp. DSM 45814]
MRVYVVVPGGFDDHGRPSGGNIYDRWVCAGLAASGWDVRIITAAGAWPTGDSGGLGQALAAIPDGETVLIDGLIASPSAAQLLPHARRLRLVVLLHMPLATALDGCHDGPALRSERAVLAVAAGVVVTSEWSRDQVLRRFSIPADRVRVARPGADRGDSASRLREVPAAGGHLLCVAALARHKGQDLLIEALAGLVRTDRDTDWDLVLVGPLDREPEFTDRVSASISQQGLNPRVRLAGVLTGAALHRAYADADLLVVPSRSETYGMVVTEALAHGLPVLATAVGGLPEALGFAPDGSRPGMLVPPDDPAALTAALAQWLHGEPNRQQLRAAAFERRSRLPRWNDTVREVAAALHAASLGCG